MLYELFLLSMCDRLWLTMFVSLWRGLTSPIVGKLEAPPRLDSVHYSRAPDGWPLDVNVFRIWRMVLLTKSRNCNV